MSTPQIPYGLNPIQLGTALIREQTSFDLKRYDLKISTLWLDSLDKIENLKLKSKSRQATLLLIRGKFKEFYGSHHIVIMLKNPDFSVFLYFFPCLRVFPKKYTVN